MFDARNYDGEGCTLEEALGRGEVKIEGKEEEVERLLTLFPLPAPVADAAGA